MVTHVFLESSDDDKPQGSRASPDGSQTAGGKETCTPEKFREKEHAEVKPQIAEEGVEAEGIVERQRVRLCVAQRPAEPQEQGDTSELRLCYPKAVSVGASFEHCVEFSDAEYELRPAATCAAGTSPVSDRLTDMPGNETMTESARVLVSTGGRSAANLV
ncbi:hypothetical protein MRX96_043091 [Rhipicephalus microplus]